MIKTSVTPGSTMIRDEIWSKEIQEELLGELSAESIVRWIGAEFSDGDTLTIPTLSTLIARDYTENSDITIDDPSVGEFQLVIDKYIQSAIGYTDKQRQDTYYMEMLTSIFPRQIVRALMDKLENDIFELHKLQTDNDANEINGYAHRFDATGTSQVITLADVAKAKLALDKANVSKNGRFAIIDPSVSYTLINTDNVIRQDVYGPNSKLKDGFGGTKFIGTYLGFDFFESNYLDDATALDYTTGGTEIANLFCGEDCFVGSVRTMPELETIRQGEKLRTVVNAVMRYGVSLYRPESLVTVLTAPIS